MGWDLSVGLPTLIARDTRFGTPNWYFDDPWSWGGMSLVPENANDCATRGACTYRTVPDSSARIFIDQRTGSAAATVTFPSGIVLTYEAVHYDGKTYPASPAGKNFPGTNTDVFAFILSSTRDPKGYLTCFINHHWGDTITGRSAVLAEIRYGSLVKDCKDWGIQVDPSDPKLKKVHRVTLEYGQLSSEGYFAPVSFRFGAPVSFDNILIGIKIYPADEVQDHPDSGYRLDFEGPSYTETRLPRLRAVVEQVWLTGKMEQRTIREFTYGNRNLNFNTEPKLLKLENEQKSPYLSSEYPDSLSGSISRPIRLPQIIGNPSGLFQIGNDQNDQAAPAAGALSEQWNIMDINGDGLLDLITAKESGYGRPAGWPGYETNGEPGPRPIQQQAYINEGIHDGVQSSTKVLLNTTAPGLSRAYNPEAAPETDFTPWIWQEGRGQLRTGMPESISSPEIVRGGVCPPWPNTDTRMWPFYPDDTPMGFPKS